LDTLRKPIELTAIVWPVFKLGIREPEMHSKIIYYANQHINEDNQIKTNSYIVDDKNIDKDTLGLRRLFIPKEDLYPLSTAIYTLQDLIKLAKSNVWFVDNSGRVFQYKKSTRAKLQTHRIIKVLPVSAIGCVLEIEGFSERFKSMTVPKEERYAAILSYNGKNILYGLYSEKIKPTWRLV
jgi:hypothetical protein